MARYLLKHDIRFMTFLLFIMKFWKRLRMGEGHDILEIYVMSWRKGNIKKTVFMLVHNGMSSSYRLVDYIGR